MFCKCQWNEKNARQNRRGVVWKRNKINLKLQALFGQPSHSDTRWLLCKQYQKCSSLAAIYARITWPIQLFHLFSTMHAADQLTNYYFVRKGVNWPFGRRNWVFAISIAGSNCISTSGNVHQIYRYQHVDGTAQLGYLHICSKYQLAI